MTVSENSPYWAIYLNQNKRCRWCGEEFPFAEMTRDHLLPKSRGHVIYHYHENETPVVLNVVLACENCNKLKSNLTLDEFETVINDKLTKFNAKRLHIILQSIHLIKPEVEKNKQLAKRIVRRLKRRRQRRKKNEKRKIKQYEKRNDV